ncbi:hypothetical protein JDV02_002600 [Purpureocillium takamizusanense]|uniref:C2H2-type domain-containing protein n=1 Tax=Purpureocillium takamizusanense TaxID=2060973 RepID=A0A9Q8Q9P8_9HYPO|nr:uncharacterized protein JDV02_002600 [Purpureocillium takamizusanense]UNI16133.1 hypothetical protein JDV02_002600 [Purpureocillium takamizusanense]
MSTTPSGTDAPPPPPPPRDIRSFFTLRPQQPSQQPPPPPSQLPMQDQDHDHYHHQHHPWPRSRTPTKRSSPTGSSDDEDPLSGGSARGAFRLAPPASSATSRIAVMLPAPSAARALSPGRPVVSDLVPRPRPHGGHPSAVKKETPVPLPRMPNLNPAASTSAPVLRGAPPASVGGRGRPKGWKPGMSYSVMRGNEPHGSAGRPRSAKPRVGPGHHSSLPPGTVIRRRGRPPKAPSPPPDAVYRSLRPQFVDFLCEWAGCRAELHNLETLRRHVWAVHGRSETCRWAKCAARDPPATLATGDELRRHVDEAHLVPFAWHIGDGPQNCLASRERKGRRGSENDDDHGRVPTFLLDRDGNQVTPSVQGQQTEDLTTWRINRRKLKDLLIRRNDALPDEDSSDEPGDDGDG